jgi:TRAP-type C4-dicarboxylate transport system permease small subunit
MLEKFKKFNQRISGWAEWIGFGAIFFMVVLTCVDVLGAKLFYLPVFGSLDALTLAQFIAMSFAAAMAFIKGRHVEVEFFMLLFPERIQAFVSCLVKLLCLGLFILIIWRLFAYGYRLQISGEETATAHIPLFPFTYASAVAMIPVCLVLVQQFFSSALRVIKK